MDVKSDPDGKSRPDVKSKKAIQSERTRRALLKAAERLFGTRGYEETRLDDVASAARVTKGALYHQFRDKRDLFAAAVGVCAQEVGKQASRESREHVERMGMHRKQPARYLVGLEILIDSLCEPATRRILLVDGPAVLGPAQWHALFGQQMLRTVGGVFRDAFRRGELDPELVDPLSHMLYGALREMALAIGSSDDPAAARDRFGEAARWVLEAVLARAASPAPAGD